LNNLVVANAAGAYAFQMLSPGGGINAKRSSSVEATGFYQFWINHTFRHNFTVFKKKVDLTGNRIAK